jgi:ABC-type glutathione transport system ATPase component
MQQGSFAWDNPNTRALSKVTFEVKKGELLGIIGPVGTGKVFFHLLIYKTKTNISQLTKLKIT